MEEYGKRLINWGWEFQVDGMDQSYESVQLPHDYSIRSYYSLDNISGKKGAFLKTGKLIYRKQLTVDMSKRNFLQFDGVYKDARVYVDEQEVIHFPYGYLGFRVEITDYVKQNQITIRVTVDDSIGESSRWYNGLGIYRNVWLIEKNQEMILPETHLYFDEIEEDSAILHVACKTEGAKNKRITLYNQEQLEVLSHTTQSDTTYVAVEKPHFWSVDHPYLYSLQIELLDHMSRVVDMQMIHIGIRTIEFNGERGFFLNGKSTKIRGACLHHDIGGIGAAISVRQQKERIMKLKAAGFNAIRTGHTPFEPEFYELCNHLGMMVMDEMFDGWYQKAVDDYAGNYFLERGVEDLVLFLKRDRNHPCVIIWGIGNETGDTDVHGLTKVCHTYDNTRPVSGGQLLYGTDLIGLNGPSEAPGYLEELFARRPEMPVLLAEYPHCYQTRGYYRTQTWWRDYGRPRFDIADYATKELFDDYSPEFGKVVRYNSSYDNASCRISHKDCIRRMEDFEHLQGMFMWTGYDYMGESFGWPFRFGNYGLIDLCGFEKDAYYLYQSEWTDTPMVHMLPHWKHEGKEGLLIPVVVYTNCHSVELFLNGKSFGKQQKKNKMELLWNIPYESGEILAKGYVDGIPCCCDQKVTEGNTACFTLLPEAPLDQDGYDVVGVTIKATDANGNFANFANDIVYVQVDGGGSLYSLENGDPFDMQIHTDNNRRLFYGLERVYIRSNGMEEATILKAYSVMGERYFKEQTVISICAKEYIVGSQKERKQEGTIQYTLDGSCPLSNGVVYQESFVLTETTTVKAVLVVDGNTMFFENTFTKGEQTMLIEELQRPLDVELVGCWKDGDTVIAFLEDGVAELYECGVKVHEVSWWYEKPIDEFESDTGDIDCGEIQFPFHNIPLKLWKDGTLRYKQNTPECNEVRYFSKCD